MSEHSENPQRKALNQKEAAAYIGVSLKYLQVPRGRELFPPVRVGKRSIYYTDMLDRQIEKLAIESGAMPAGGQS